MNTDTENGSLATEAETKRIDELLVKLKAWVAEKEITFDAVAAAFGGDEPRGVEQQLPPFHTSVVWGDIFTPDGIKLHVVARAGATRSSVLGTVFAASNAFTQLIELGWIPADRRPRTEAEIAETKVKLEERFAASKASKAAKEPAAKAGAKRAKKAGATPDSGDVEGSTRTIKVESILKRVTDTGNINYLVKGHPWKKYGVTAWPDSGQVYKLDAAVDLEKWAVGELVGFSDVDLQAVVQLKEGGKPGKVIDFVGADTLDDDPNV